MAVPKLTATHSGGRIVQRSVGVTRRKADERKLPVTSALAATSIQATAREHRGRRLDIVSAASCLGLTEHHLRQLVFERRLTHFKLGRRVAFDTVDLDAYLEANRREAPQRGERIRR